MKHLSKLLVCAILSTASVAAIAPEANACGVETMSDERRAQQAVWAALDRVGAADEVASVEVKLESEDRGSALVRFRKGDGRAHLVLVKRRGTWTVTGRA